MDFTLLFLGIISFSGLFMGALLCFFIPEEVRLFQHAFLLLFKALFALLLTSTILWLGLPFWLMLVILCATAFLFVIESMRPLLYHASALVFFISPHYLFVSYLLFSLGLVFTPLVLVSLQKKDGSFDRLASLNVIVKQHFLFLILVFLAAVLG